MGTKKGVHASEYCTHFTVETNQQAVKHLMRNLQPSAAERIRRLYKLTQNDFAVMSVERMASVVNEALSRQPIGRIRCSVLEHLCGYSRVYCALLIPWTVTQLHFLPNSATDDESKAAALMMISCGTIRGLDSANYSFDFHFAQIISGKKQNYALEGHGNDKKNWNPPNASVRASSGRPLTT